MSKPTPATKYFHAAANRMRAGGVSVEVESHLSTVSIDCQGQESIFMQGDEADTFADEVSALCKRFRSLDEYTAALALAAPYAETLWS